MTEVQQKGLTDMILPNHQTSNQNNMVKKRYAFMRKYGSYQAAKAHDPNNEILNTNKRNYNVLDAKSQSSTIMTIGDDYCHYGDDRSLTVREMQDSSHLMIVLFFKENVQQVVTKENLKHHNLHKLEMLFHLLWHMQ